MKSKLSIVLTSFLFGFMLMLFPMTAEAATEVTIPKGTIDAEIFLDEIIYDSETYGYIFQGTDEVRTFTYKYSFNSDDEGTQDLNSVFYIYLKKGITPTITATSGYEYGKTEIMDTRIYFECDGNYYATQRGSDLITIDGGFNNITVLVEVDVRFWNAAVGWSSGDANYVWYGAEVTIPENTVIFGKVAASEYNYLRTMAVYLNDLSDNLYALQEQLSTQFTAISSRLQTMYSDFRTDFSNILASINNNFTSLKTNLGAWFDRQHQDFIDLKNNLFAKLDEVRKYIGNWFDRQHQDMLDLGDKLTNSYDTTNSDKTTTNFETSIGNYEKVESELTDKAIGNFKEYTIPEKGIAAYGTQMVGAMSLVSSMMQSIYTSMGDFNIIISVGFGLVITSMLVGLYKFFK